MKKPVSLYRRDQQFFYILLLQLLHCFSCHILYFANITFIFIYYKRHLILYFVLNTDHYSQCFRTKINKSNAKI